MTTSGTLPTGAVRLRSGNDGLLGNERGRDKQQDGSGRMGQKADSCDTLRMSA